MEFGSVNLQALCLAVLLCGVAAGATPNREQVTVLVYNSEAVEMSVLQAGEAEAGGILGQAGIEVVWVNCTYGAVVVRACMVGSDLNNFVLRVVHDGRTSSDSVFGEAFLGEGGIGKYCVIFFGRIRKAQRNWGVDPAQLLGAVAAHELGHLLLGSHAHSRTGIMAATWESESLRSIDRGTMLFTRDQASAMQSRAAQSRMSIARLGSGK